MNDPLHPSDTPGEARLRQSLPPLADEGFTNHVLASLPPPARKSSMRGRLVAAVAGALLGCLIVAAEAAGGADTLPDREQLTAMIAPLLTLWFDPTMWVALGTSAVSVLYAFWCGPARRGPV